MKNKNYVKKILTGALRGKKEKMTGMRLFEEIKSGNDALFISMHQIGFICSLLGLAGVVFPVSSIMSSTFTERYRVGWLLLVFFVSIIISSGTVMLRSATPA